MWNVAAVNAPARRFQQLSTIGVKEGINTDALFVFLSWSVAERWQPKLGCHCWTYKIYPWRGNFLSPVVWRLFFGIYPNNNWARRGNTAWGGQEWKAGSLEMTLSLSVYHVSIIFSPWSSNRVLFFDLCPLNSLYILFTDITKSNHIIFCFGRCSPTAMKPLLTRSSPKSFFLGKRNNLHSQHAHRKH